MTFRSHGLTSRDKLKAFPVPQCLWQPDLGGLNDPLTMWHCDILWQIKNVLSPLPQYLNPPKLAAW